MKQNLEIKQPTVVVAAAAATAAAVVTVMKTTDEDDDRRRNIALEYSKMEEKQTNLCRLLANNLYKKFDEENRREKICEQDEVNKIFHSIIELEKVAQLVHGQVASEIAERVTIWKEKPYFGDILKKYFQFYKVYKSILLRYPQSREALVDALKKQKFANSLQKLLVSEAANFDNITRLDILLDQMVNLPRRYLQLFDNYLKMLDSSSQEYDDISRIRQEFKDIQGASDTSIDKLANFQDCYKLQQMIEPSYELISDKNSNNRQLVKHGDLKKISKKSGEHLMRHLILLNDVLLICGFDLLKKKYILKFEIRVPSIKIIECSEPNNELIFRIISPEQNNEFLAEDSRDKESWIKAFKKLEIQFDSFLSSKNEIENFKLIGEVPPIWMKDDQQSHCLICRTVFTAFHRRHHCRTCGKIFCKQCCNSFILVKFDNYRDKQRVCKICDNLLAGNQPGSRNNSVTSNTLLALPTSSTVMNTSQSSLSSIATTNGDASAVAASPIISDTSNQSINDDSTSNNNVDVADEKKEKLHNELKHLLRNSKANSKLQNGINRLSCNDTSSTTTTTTNDDDDDDDDEDEINEAVAKNVNTLKELVIKHDDEELPVKPSYYKKKSITSLQIPQQQIEKPSVRKRSVPSTHANCNSASPQELFSDSVLVSKLNLSKIEVDDEQKSTNKNAAIWERKWILLTDDRILTVYSNQNDLKAHQSANNVIYLSNFQLSSLNETTFELKRKESSNDAVVITPSLAVLNNDSNSSGDAATKQQAVRKTKNFISLFEYTNYEFKFTNADNKNKLFNLINAIML